MSAVAILLLVFLVTIAIVAVVAVVQVILAAILISTLTSKLSVVEHLICVVILIFTLAIDIYLIKCILL